MHFIGQIFISSREMLLNNGKNFLFCINSFNSVEIRYIFITMVKVVLEGYMDITGGHDRIN